jgi:rhodanese-related sulfurtransferase
MNQVREITPQETVTLIKEGWKLVDVRTPAEFNELHAVGAVNIVLDKCTPESLRALGGDRFAIICQMGGRSKRACQNVSNDSSLHVVSVAGGTNAWAASGLSTKTGN